MSDDLNGTEKVDDIGPSKQECFWAMLVHISALAGYTILPMGLPIGNIIGPLIIWLIKKDEMPFVNDQGKESLNFQLMLFMVFIICWFLMIILIGFILAWMVGLIGFVLTIIAAISAYNGTRFRYPGIIRLIK